MAHDSGNQRDWASTRRRGTSESHWPTVGTRNELGPEKEKVITISFPRIANGCDSCKNARNCISTARTIFRRIAKREDVRVYGQNHGRSIVIPEMVIDECLSVSLVELNASTEATTALTDRCRDSYNGSMMDIYHDGESAYECGATGDEFTKDK